MSFSRKSVVFSLLTVLTVSGAAIADVASKPQLQKIAFNAAATLESLNVNGVRIDDEISRRTFKLYLQGLDSRKIYFTAQDIAEFAQHETSLDDQVKEGNLEFVDLVLERAKQRLQERVEQIRKDVLPALVDFTAEETVSLDFDARKWLSTPEEIADRVRKDVKAQVLSMKLGDSKLTLDEMKAKVLKGYERYAIEFNKLTDLDQVERYMDSMAHAFDPHSDYMSPTTAEQFKIQMSLKLAGVGMSLRQEEDGGVRVEDVLAGSPAALDGTLKKGDRIIGVGKDGDPMAVDEAAFASLTFNDKIGQIRGAIGTKVLIRFQPGGDVTKPPSEVVLTRAEIKFEEAKAVGEVKEITSVTSSRKHKVGMIYLPSFYRDFEGCQQVEQRLAADPNAQVEDCVSSTNDVRKILQSDEFKSAEVVVLDLRNNGGGALTDAIDITGLFIDKGPVVQSKGPRGVKVHEDKKPGVVYAGPLVILINQGSASASEIVAAALQDYGRAEIVGGDSFGKGTVQNVIPLASGPFGFGKALGMVKITIEEFFRINGSSTQDLGVVPGVKVEGIVSVVVQRENSLPHAFKHSKINPAKFTPVNSFTAENQKKLIALSEARRMASADFKKLAKEMEETRIRLADKTLSLNEAARRREVAQLQDEESVGALAEAIPLVQPKKLESAADDKEAKPPVANFYNNEMLQIAVDYLELQSPQVATN